MKRNFIIFLIILCLGIIITYPSFPVSHALDSYCTICNGYSKTALCFLQNGRVITALFYYLFKFIKLPMFSLGYLSALFTNVFLALAINSLYNKIKNKIKLKNNIQTGLCLLGIFLLFYNPLLISILLLDEAFVIAMGIYFLTLSAIKCFDGGLKNYILSGILGILGVFCYQGIASYLFAVLLILLIIDDDFNWKKFNKKILISLLIYALSNIINIIAIKLVSAFTHETIAKMGNFNLIDNVKKIFNELLPNSLKYYFGFMNVKFYYMLFLMSIIILIIGIFLNKNKIKNIVGSLLIIFACIFIPFIPNLFMATNYTDARMSLTIVSIPILLIILLFSITKNKFINLFSIIVLFGYFIMTGHSIHQNMMIDLKRYKNDIRYINEVYAKIKKYETDNDIAIKKIYYRQDTNSAYYYNFGNVNGANIRLMAVDWSFECAFPSYTNKNYKLEKMSDKKYKKYFDKLDFDKINKKEFVFDKDKLYLLIY